MIAKRAYFRVVYRKNKSPFHDPSTDHLRVTKGPAPCHHNLEKYLRDYIEAANLEPKTPLFRTLRGKSGQLTERRLHRTECLAMIRRRCKHAGIETPGICNHTFRGTGITAYFKQPRSTVGVGSATCRAFGSQNDAHV